MSSAVQDDDRFARPGEPPMLVNALVRLPWGVKRWIWSRPTMWRYFASICRRLGWSEESLGVYRANNGPFADIGVRAIHTNHLWAAMGGYEPDVSEWMTRAFADPAWFGDNRDVFDVGAYFGMLALLFAKHAERVVAFEPSPANREALERNLAVNPSLAGRVHVRPFAVSDREGSVEMTFDGVQSTNQIKTEGVRLWSNAENLPVTTAKTIPLDAMIDETPDGLPWRPGFIKIDVEGAEGLVLAGVSETLRRFRPSLLVETHNDDACATVFDELRAANYTTFRLESGRLRHAVGAWPGGYGHVAAIPSERASGAKVIQ